MLPQRIKFYFILIVNDKKDPENKLVTFDSTKGKLLSYVVLVFSKQGQVNQLTGFPSVRKLLT